MRVKGITSLTEKAIGQPTAIYLDTYSVLRSDSGESAVYTGRYLMEHGLDLYFPDIRTSCMIYFTKK